MIKYQSAALLPISGHNNKEMAPRPRLLNFMYIAIICTTLGVQTGCQNDPGLETDLCNKVPRYSGTTSEITEPVYIHWPMTPKHFTATYDDVTQTVKYGFSETPETDTARVRAIEHLVIEPRDRGAAIAVDIDPEIPADIPPFKLALTFDGSGHLTTSTVSGEAYNHLPGDLQNAIAGAFKGIAQQIKLPERSNSVKEGQIYSQLSLVDIIGPIFASFDAELRPVKDPGAGTGFVATLVGRTVYDGRDALLLETKGKETIDLLKDGNTIGRIVMTSIGYSIVDRESNITVNNDAVSVAQLPGSSRAECSEDILKISLREQ